MDADRPDTSYRGVSPERRGRLARVLPYLDCEERISRQTWGTCFLHRETGGSVGMYEPDGRGWWRRCELHLDEFDLMADDWYLVPDEQYNRWCEEMKEDR